MFAARNLQRRCLRTLSALLQSNPCKDASPKVVSSKLMQPSTCSEDNFVLFAWLSYPFNGSYRTMSTSRGRSMRSKVERRMQLETGKTLREVRRAKKIKKKLMTDEERLIYNLKRAKKKVALLLQRLKKYELPELPPSVHDPELLTAEQLQSFKKIGFKNKNYVPVGVRGVFGGVVQNMHLHWKFHETVQVCCDNFPKEKIKEMATMLARLSGGIVINIHNTKTIIMFRGRNYRQPKNLIPINTLTKRKALFKARFEQALESQKLNIKKIEQELRRKGINPEDPVAMASIQRVASTFFNAIDQKEGSPYVFHGDKHSVAEPKMNQEFSETSVESDEEDLKKFISEIEDAADQEFAQEEAAEKEEFGKIRYWNKEEFGGRSRRSEAPSSYYSADVKGSRSWKDGHGHKRNIDSDYEGNDNFEDNDEWESGNDRDLSELESEDDNSEEEVNDAFRRSTVGRGKKGKFSRSDGSSNFMSNAEVHYRQRFTQEDSESENMFSRLDDVMHESDEGELDFGSPNTQRSYNYRSSDEESESYPTKKDKHRRVPDDEAFDSD